VLGVPFYGRGFAGVKSLHNGINQPYERYEADHSYDELVGKFIGKQARWHDVLGPRLEPEWRAAERHRPGLRALSSHLQARPVAVIITPFYNPSEPIVTGN